jgi:5-methylcytosine-specific restriction protein A
MPAPFATATRSSNLYGTTRWRQESRAFLLGRICVDCGKSATITDHEPPHRGNETAFWDRSTWQSRCHSCHQAKTGREVAARRPSRQRERERHPGVLKI